MAKSLKKLKSPEHNDAQFKLLYDEDEVSKFWNSSLFNTVYLRHDVMEKHQIWEAEDEEFRFFQNAIRNLVSEYKSKEKSLVSMSERNLQNGFIKEILRALHWENEVSKSEKPYLDDESFSYKGRIYKPDILIVDHPDEKVLIDQKSGDEKLYEARRNSKMVVEVKYWQRLEEYRQEKKEDKSKLDSREDDFSKISTPNEQIVRYMELLKSNWGILTDGSKWRLFNIDLSQEDSERYYEFDFYQLFRAIATEETEADSKVIDDSLKYFYFFFSKYSFFPKNEGECPFVDEVLQYSKKYANQVEEDLKVRFVKAMNIACNAFFRSAKINKESEDFSVIRTVAESALFNILFIKSLESRSVLPMTSTDYKKISLSSIIDKIEKYDPESENGLNIRNLERNFIKGNGNAFKYKSDGLDLHQRILRITGVIHKGTSVKDNFGFEIAGFRESVFSDEEWNFFEKCQIENNDWVRILFELGYADANPKTLARKYQQIPYSYFTPRQLGSIYESFLEFKLDKADDNLVFERKQWKAADLNSSKYRLADIPKVKKGELFFTPDNADRKATGSYYTPDYIVHNLVAKSLTKIMGGLKSPEEIKSLKICDPAMGSGHFLVATLNQLSKIYVDSLSEKGTHLSNQEAKNVILSNCIYGVDINARAVKLAKMSLWLESAHSNHKLEDLSDQIKVGDSLISGLDNYPGAFNWKKEFSFLNKKRFDLIIGNPPYISMKKFPKTEDKRIIKEYCLKHYKTFSAKSDYFCCFVERFLESKSELLSDSGVVSFVLSKTFLAEPSFQEMRDILWDNSVTSLVIHNPNAFEGVGVKTASLIVSRIPNEDNVCHFFSDAADLSEFVEIGNCKQKILKDFGKFIQVPDPENIKILKKIGILEKADKFMPLESVCKHGGELGFLNGVQTGDNGYWLVEGASSQRDAEHEFKRRGHTKLNVMKYHFGQNVNQFSTDWERSWINYDPSGMTKHSKSARPRAFYQDKTHAFYNSSERVLNSFISSEKITCDFDLENKIVDNNLNILIPDLKYIGAVELTGILNSKLIGEYLLINLRSNLSVSQSLLANIPVPRLNTKERTLLREIVLKIKKSEQKSRPALIKKLDDFIFKLYGITEDEKKYIDKLLIESKSGEHENEELEQAA